MATTSLKGFPSNLGPCGVCVTNIPVERIFELRDFTSWLEGRQAARRKDVIARGQEILQ